MKEYVLTKKGIITLAALKATGKKVAFIKGNRQVQEKNVNAKRASLMENGQIIPAVIVDGEEVQSVDLEIVDAETGKPVVPEDHDKYVVILDGQHRYTAYIQNGDKNKGEFYFMYPLNEGITLQKILSEANIATKMWDGKDFASGALMMNPDKDLPLLEAIVELLNQGFPLATVQKWLCFKNAGITKEVLAKAMNGKIDEKLQKTPYLEKGKRLLKAAQKSFNNDFLGKRYLVDLLIEKYENADDEKKAETMNQLVEFLSGIDRSKAEEIEKAKGSKGIITKEQVILNKLNELYNSKFGA
ncbi:MULTISPECIES: hypothetical protein [Butyricimonas]|uniref:hypothetical protein n=1 Tax=Butyricimonas TaxID=574697 RepID=UPI0007FB473E|nr:MULTISPECIES: hypothetical protein [Butyricimonas]